MRTFAPGFVHVPYPHPYRSPLAPPRPGGTGDATVDYIRDHVLFHAIDPDEVAGVIDRADRRLGRRAGAAGRLLAGADGAVPRARLAALRRRGEDRLRPHRADVRRRALGRAARHRLPGQGDGRRRDADRRRAGHRAGDGRVRRRPHRQHLGVAARRLRGRAARRSRSSPTEPVLENVRALERRSRGGARRARRPPRAGRRRARQGLLPGDRVRARPATRERDPELQQRVAEEALRRGVLADSSTTSTTSSPRW